MLGKPCCFSNICKISPPSNVKIDTLILNGCECEPYLTRDYRLMLERTNDLLIGLKVIMEALNLEKSFNWNRG